MNDRLVPGIAVIVVLILLLALMFFAWRRRKNRDADLVSALAALPAVVTPRRADDAILYVATTRADEPLERVALAGLGIRARAQLTVADEGLVLAPHGEHPQFIPAVDLRGAGTATWTIDRVVESDGLIMIRWALGGRELDSYVRVINSQEHTSLIEAITALVPTVSSRNESETSS